MDIVFNAHRYFAVNSYIVVFVHNREKDELKLIAEQIKLDGITPLVNQRKNFAISYIRRLVNINKHCFGLLLISIFMDVLCWIGMRISFLFNKTTLFWLLIIIIALTIIMSVYVAYMGYRLAKQYISDVKI